MNTDPDQTSAFLRSHLAKLIDLADSGSITNTVGKGSIRTDL